MSKIWAGVVKKNTFKGCEKKNSRGHECELQKRHRGWCEWQPDCCYQGNRYIRCSYHKEMMSIYKDYKECELTVKDMMILFACGPSAFRKTMEKKKSTLIGGRERVFTCKYS